MDQLKYLIVAGLLGLATLLASPAGAAPQAEAWPRWQGSEAQSTRQVDHGTWAHFLGSDLVPGQNGEPNRLRYGAVSAADRAALQDYLKALGSVPVAKLNRAEQKAYWINLYNALTIATILGHYPVQSIRDIKSGWFSPGPWDLKLTTVDGTRLSLNDIEHRILRPIWHDNRVHYAVNCASLGCPNLQPEPFTAENSERLLDQAARDFVNSPRGARFDGSSLVLSSIYDWYQVDFGGTESGVLAHLERFASPELAARLRTFGGDVTYQYDWRLNDLR